MQLPRVLEETIPVVHTTSTTPAYAEDVYLRKEKTTSFPANTNNCSVSLGNKYNQGSVAVYVVIRCVGRLFVMARRRWHKSDANGLVAVPSGIATKYYMPSSGQPHLINFSDVNARFEMMSYWA